MTTERNSSMLLSGAQPKHTVRPRYTIVTNAAKFPLGQVVATPGSLELLDTHSISPVSLLTRHLQGDWGDVAGDDASLNELALQDGSRIFSIYRLASDDAINATPHSKRHTLPTAWVITDAASDTGIRAATTLLLPEDY